MYHLESDSNTCLQLYKKETASYHGPLGEGRAEWAMSSDDLNKIVRDTASRGAGLGKVYERALHVSF